MREISDLKYSSANLFMWWLVLCLKVQRCFQVSDENRSSLATIFPRPHLYFALCMSRTGSPYAEVFRISLKPQADAESANCCSDRSHLDCPL